jgi:tripartite-type tricarboxylate transporter receptor subunit TctC
LAIAAASIPLAAWGQAWPTKPIRMVVPVPPGGANDLLARILGAKLSDALGQPVIIENQGGAGGTIAAAQVSRAPADGYTILLTSVSHVTNVFVKKDLPYDPINDFTPITAAAQILTCLAVNNSVPANNIKELIDYSIRNPTKLAYGSPGAGTNLHLLGELFKMTTGAQLLHISYRGTGPALADMMGGQIQAVITSISALPRGPQANNVKVLAVLESKRNPRMPDVPALHEVVPAFNAPVSWFGLLGPAKLPQPIAARLSAETAKALQSPDAQAKLEAASLGVIASSPADFAAMMKDSHEGFGKVVKVLGLKPE